MAEEEKAIRVIPFTGEWEYWEAKQLGRANRRGYKDIMIGKEAVPSDSDPMVRSTRNCASSTRPDTKT